MQRPAIANGLVAALSFVLCNAAHAGLVGNGNGLVYDSDRTITWVSDADLFGTLRRADAGIVDRIIQDFQTLSNGRTTHTLSTADFSASDPSSNFYGAMTWWGAVAFAAELAKTKYDGYDDWRLPTSRQPDAGCSQQIHINANDTNVSQGTGCTGSELGHLFYEELGGKADMNLATMHNDSYGLFSDVRSDDWTGTTLLVPSAGDAAWDFDTTNGRQQFLSTGDRPPIDNGAYSFAWIVRTGALASDGPMTPNGVPEPVTVSLTLAGLITLAIARRCRRADRSGLAKRAVAVAAGLLTIGVVSGTAHAALIDRGNGMIYDTDRNITWAQDVTLLTTMYAADPDLLAKIIAASPTVSDGRTTHNLTTADFQQLFYTATSYIVRGSWWGDTAFARFVRLGGFSDWRLPTTPADDVSPCIDAGYGAPNYGACHGSELGHVYYDELGGGVAGVPDNGNSEKFEHIRQSNFGYWSATTFTLDGRFTGGDPLDGAYYMNDVGNQNVLYNLATYLDPWIVRTGDVIQDGGQGGGSTVPEPATIGLTLAGLGLMAAVRRRSIIAARYARAAAAMATLAFVSGAAHASLVNNGGGLIYDTDLNITWAQDVSLLTTMLHADGHLFEKIVAAEPTVVVDGYTHTLTTADFRDLLFATADRAESSWWGSVAFARYVTLGGSNGWRLPTTLNPDPSCSYNGGPAVSNVNGCSGSEMGHIYYSEFGAYFFAAAPPSHPDNYALFPNFSGAGGFWSGTTYSGTPYPESAFYFTPDGQQGLFSDFSAYSTPWIVHDGDVGAAAQPGGGGGSTVPEPAVVSLMFAGMGAIGVVGRRRRARAGSREVA